MHIAQVKYIIEVHKKQEKEIMPVRLITGEDLMKEFRMSPGRTIGRLLDLDQGSPGSRRDTDEGGSTAIRPK